MKKFRALVHGKNFALRDMDGAEPRMFGFYKTVYVEAVDFPMAELAAVEVLRHDDQLKTTTCNDRSNPPILEVDKMQELESFDGVKLPREPFVFYKESDDDAEAASKSAEQAVIADRANCP